MPALKTGTKNQSKAKKSTSNAKPSSAKLDILFGGPLFFVPSVNKGKIEGVEVFSPSNGHPVGAVFLPGIWFTDAELNDPDCERWPKAESFSLLDPHSYHIELAQKGPGKTAAFPVASIPADNHKVKPGRTRSHHWEVAIRVEGNLSNWGSYRHRTVEPGMYGGSDAPTVKATASLHRLTYEGVTSADFGGIAGEPKEYLRTNIAKGGSLIVVGEIPYQSSLLHERHAVDALAKLVGLDLHLLSTAPTTTPGRLMHHVLYCGLSTIEG